jgi:hypothetical protein
LIFSFGYLFLNYYCLSNSRREYRPVENVFHTRYLHSAGMRPFIAGCIDFVEGCAVPDGMQNSGGKGG